VDGRIGVAMILRNRRAQAPHSVGPLVAPPRQPPVLSLRPFVDAVHGGPQVVAERGWAPSKAGGRLVPLDRPRRRSPSRVEMRALVAERRPMPSTVDPRPAPSDGGPQPRPTARRCVG